MATTFRIKSKTFSNQNKVYRLQRIYADVPGEGEQKGLSTGAKVGLGVAGTALATGAAFMGARRGMFGANLMKSSNKLWGSAGKALGSQSMVQSANKGFKKAGTLEALNNGGRNAVRDGYKMTTKAGKDTKTWWNSNKDNVLKNMEKAKSDALYNSTVTGSMGGVANAGR